MEKSVAAKREERGGGGRGEGVEDRGRFLLQATKEKKEGKKNSLDVKKARDGMRKANNALSAAPSLTSSLLLVPMAVEE